MHQSQVRVFLLLLFFGAMALVTSGIVPQADKAVPTLTVSFLDVGQGDAILLTTPSRRHILVDGGPDSSVLTRLGETMPFFDHEFDLVIASHNHADHITGLNEVLKRYDVSQLWIPGAIHTTNEYLELLHLVKDKQIPTEVVWQGKEKNIDGVGITVLHPITSMEGQQPDDQHDATIVVRVVFGESEFLLTGDIDEEHEQVMIQSGVSLASDVLKVAHHGSKSGLALNFLAAVNPQYAVIQVGERNRYGHPAQSILDKLNERNIRILRNDQHGTIRFSTDGQTIQLVAPKVPVSPKL
jgi:competence protein ComEC